LRKYVIGAAVVVTALITAAVALAVTQRTYNQTFATSAKGAPTKKPNKPSGSFFSETSTDPANTTGNKQPKQDKSVDDIFPPGAVLNTAIPASCTADDGTILSSGGAICPAKSKVGSGVAFVRLNANGTKDIKATIKAYNCQKSCKPPAGSGIATTNELILYVNPQGSNPILLRGTIQGKAGQTQKLHVPIPIKCVFGNPPNCGPNGDARIVKFSLTIDKVVKKQAGKPDKGYLTTPKKCPSSKNWLFTIKFNGRDGKTQTKTSNSPCTP
jgi:hypothetical protein